jgi:cytochrome c-type biogenesis protein
MNAFWEPFALGNAAILGNVCMLPLYPGMFVMFTQQTANPRARRWMPALGIAVLAGVISMLVVVGAVLHALSTTVADVLDWLLPSLYVTVALLGIAMIAGRNPFERLPTTNAPVFRNPVASAYAYGALLAPMTLPCTGPLIISAFTIGSVAGAGGFADSVWYFLAFGLGFGWPLVALPLVARPAQRFVTGFLGRHHRAVGALSGVLLVVIGVVGIRTDVLPSVGA